MHVILRYLNEETTTEHVKRNTQEHQHTSDIIISSICYCNITRTDRRGAQPPPPRSPDARSLSPARGQRQ